MLPLRRRKYRPDRVNKERRSKKQDLTQGRIGVKHPEVGRGDSKLSPRYESRSTSHLQKENVLKSGQ